MFRFLRRNNSKKAFLVFLIKYECNDMKLTGCFKGEDTVRKTNCYYLTTDLRL